MLFALLIAEKFVNAEDPLITLCRYPLALFRLTTNDKRSDGRLANGPTQYARNS